MKIHLAKGFGESLDYLGSWRFRAREAWNKAYRRFYRPGNRLYIETLEADYPAPPFAFEAIELVLHAPFQAFKNYYEFERGPKAYQLVYPEDPDPDDYPDWPEMYEFEKANAEDKRRYAREADDLYDWWTRRRPARKDPVLENDLPEEERYVGGSFLVPDPSGNGGGTVAESTPAYKAILEESNRLEEEWNREDEEMMCRLAKIRLYLWD